MKEQPDRELLENLANSIRLGRGATMDQISALREEYRSMESRVGRVADTSLNLAADAEAQANKATSEVAPLREELGTIWNLSGSSIARSLTMTSVMELNRYMVTSAVIWAATRDLKAMELFGDCANACREIEERLGAIPTDMDLEGKLDIVEACTKIVDELGKRCRSKAKEMGLP